MAFINLTKAFATVDPVANPVPSVADTIKIWLLW